jgi:serine/threonine protein kinase
MEWLIPYIAPEIFKGSKLSKASDIYSMGNWVWPFSNVVDLICEIIIRKRPDIT